ncbi:MAG: hypothetical protein FWG81_11030 [Betaproteobacteria bacterium]|nr:hypothetical protein [Betaproteobacteria bacterium]
MAAFYPKALSRKSGASLFSGVALFVAALALSWLALPGAGEARAEGFLPRLNLDLRETTVSGISSGAFMATQMAVAHSASIRGVAVTAGGPYFCAGEDSWRGAGVTNAIARCMQGDPMFPAKAITEADQRLMQDTTRRWAAGGAIDSLDELARQKVWIFHGYNDGIVKRPVSEALETYYRAFLPAHQIFHKRELPAAHAQISAACASGRDKAGASCNVCNMTGGNYINACSVGRTPYDAAGMALQFFYGPMQRTASNRLKGELISFSQVFYTIDDGEEIEPGKISMAEEGYLYAPSTCMQGEACRLHIAFHGCKQYAGKINMDFVKGAGYNEWAEQNRLVILFPQAASSAILPMNPNGCWDWWGYNDMTSRQVGRYATKEGLQIAAVWRMAQALANSGGLDDEVEDFVPAGEAAALPLAAADTDEAEGVEDAPVAKAPARKVRVTAPVARVLDVSSSQALLVWKAVPEAVAYQVYRLTPSSEPKGKPAFLSVTPEGFTDTAYVDDGLEEKTSYQYKVAALDETGREVLGKPLTAHTLGVSPACDPYYSMLAERTVTRNGIPTDATCP